MKKRRLTTRDHGQKLPVDLLLLFTNRLERHRGETRNLKRNATTELEGIAQCFIVLMTDLLCCAVGPGLVYETRGVAVCWTLHHFDGKGLLIHAGAGAACGAQSTKETANTK